MSQARRAWEPSRALPRRWPEGAQKPNVRSLSPQATSLQRLRCNLHLRLRCGLSSTASGDVDLGRRGRRAEEELEVHVASVRDLCDVVAGASERLLSADLAAEFLIAVVRIRYVGRLHQRLATTTAHLSVDAFQTEVPETAAGHLVRAQALLGFQILLGVLDAGLRAVVLVVGTVIVEAVLREVHRPFCSVGDEVFLRRGRSIGVQDLTDHPLVVEGVELPEGARRAGGRRICCARSFEKGKLTSITQKAKAAPLTVHGKRRLKRTRKGQLAVGCRARAGQARSRCGRAAFPVHVGLLHRRREVHMLAQSAVLVFSPVHAALSLLPRREGLRAQVDAQLPARLPR